MIFSPLLLVLTLPPHWGSEVFLLCPPLLTSSLWVGPWPLDIWNCYSFHSMASNWQTDGGTDWPPVASKKGVFAPKSHLSPLRVLSPGLHSLSLTHILACSLSHFHSCSCVLLKLTFADTHSRILLFFSFLFLSSIQHTHTSYLHPLNTPPPISPHNPGSAAYHLCDLEQVISPKSVSPSIKQENATGIPQRHCRFSSRPHNKVSITIEPVVVFFLVEGLASNL